MADKATADTTTANETWNRWHTELEMAGKAKGFRQWQNRARKIIKRYRDDRGDGDGAGDGMGGEAVTASRFNILWSNVQTLKPALFAKTPKPVVERRYLDRDDVGRTASVILERALMYELDEGGYKAAVEKAVLDRLLPGRGVVWLRYEPKFAPIQGQTQEVEDAGLGMRAGSSGGSDVDGSSGAGGDASLTSPDQTEEGEEVASESTCVDYVDWTDFTTSPARTWEEVWWIDRRVYMTRAQGVKRFGAKFTNVTLDWSPNKDMNTAPSTSSETGNNDGQKRATIHETWCKTDRKVYWWAKSWSDEMLDEKDDPLRLENFWPVPKPLFASTTNETLIPVPDYYEYQDQAVELDDLTNRIAWLTKSIKSCGVYDASVTELERMFSEGFENRLVPCDNMAEFAQKAGANGMGHIWLLPILDQAKVLGELYIAREQVKQSLYEITGISDIVRGAATGGGAKTATEQRIKGQFASMRLNDMQAEVARFCRDTLRIMGEIISEHFDPMTLFLVSGFEEYAKEQWPPEAPTPPQPGQQVMGGNGPPPGPLPGQVPPGGPPPMPPGQPIPGSMGAPMLPPDPVAVARAKAADMFKQAVALLKNDKLRGFRIDIETDSIVEPDQQAMQQARTELLAAVAQFLPQAIQAGMAMPELKPLLARLLMFFLRGFKASRDIESAFEQFVDDMTKEAANPKPKPPSPEQQKLELEKAQAQLDAQRSQMEMQLKQQESAQALQLQEREMQMKQQLAEQELQNKMRLEEMRVAADIEIARFKADSDARLADQKMQHDRDRGAQEIDMARQKNDAEISFKREDSEANRELARDEKQLPKRGDLDKVVEGHRELVSSHKDGIKAVRDGVEKISKRLDGVEQTVKDIHEEAGAPVEIIRGVDGRASGFKKGKRTMTLKRGANGRTEAVQ